MQETLEKKKGKDCCTCFNCSMVGYAKNEFLQCKKPSWLECPTPTFFILFYFIDSFVNLWWLQASKVALISFFETWRAELGSDIGITIVTPGLNKSEMSDSANLSKVYFELNEAWKLILHQPMILNQVYFAFMLEAMKCLKPLDTKRVRRSNSIE